MLEASTGACGADLERTTSGDASGFKTFYHGHHLLIHMIAGKCCVGAASIKWPILAKLSVSVKLYAIMSNAIIVPRTAP